MEHQCSPTSEVLTSRGLVLGNRLGVGQISKLVAGLCALCLDILCNGACKV